MSGRHGRCCRLVVAGVLLLLAVVPRVAGAERRFTYVYDSEVEEAGEREIELWTTFRRGRQGGLYNRFDERIEFEIGLTDRLETAFYLNTSATTFDENGDRTTKFEFTGISSEWIYQFLDAAKDPVGLALYFEGSAGPSEAELEGKIILDKSVGNFLAAINLVGANEWDYSSRQNRRTADFEFDAGVSYAFTKRFAAGIEIKNLNVFPAGRGFDASVLFAGPVLSFAASKWWAALTVMPQVVALKGATKSHLRLTDNERIQTRLLMGFEF